MSNIPQVLSTKKSRLALFREFPHFFLPFFILFLKKRYGKGVAWRITMDRHGLESSKFSRKSKRQGIAKTYSNSPLSKRRFHENIGKNWASLFKKIKIFTKIKMVINIWKLVSILRVLGPIRKISENSRRIRRKHYIKMTFSIEPKSPDFDGFLSRLLYLRIPF